MAYQINLLAWREKEREKYKRRFLLILSFGVFLSVSFQWGWAQYLSLQHSTQVNRNQSLDTHINWLNSELKELNEIGKQHEAILTRLAVVEELQQNRNKTTQLLNLLPGIVTEGIYLNKVRMHKRSIEIKGFSDSNARLATILDKLERSLEVESVEMHSIISGKQIFGHDVSSFELSFKLLSTTKSGEYE